MKTERFQSDPFLNLEEEVDLFAKFESEPDPFSGLVEAEENIKELLPVIDLFDGLIDEDRIKEDLKQLNESLRAMQLFKSEELRVFKDFVEYQIPMMKEVDIQTKKLTYTNVYRRAAISMAPLEYNDKSDKEMLRIARTSMLTAEKLTQMRKSTFTPAESIIYSSFTDFLITSLLNVENEDLLRARTSEYDETKLELMRNCLMYLNVIKRPSDLLEVDILDNFLYFRMSTCYDKIYSLNIEEQEKLHFEQSLHGSQKTESSKELRDRLKLLEESGELILGLTAEDVVVAVSGKFSNSRDKSVVCGCEEKVEASMFIFNLFDAGLVKLSTKPECGLMSLNTVKCPNCEKYIILPIDIQLKIREIAVLLLDRELTTGVLEVREYVPSFAYLEKYLAPFYSFEDTSKFTADTVIKLDYRKEYEIYKNFILRLENHSEIKEEFLSGMFPYVEKHKLDLGYLNNLKVQSYNFLKISYFYDVLKDESHPMFGRFCGYTYDDLNGAMEVILNQMQTLKDVTEGVDALNLFLGKFSKVKNSKDPRNVSKCFLDSLDTVWLESEILALNTKLTQEICSIIWAGVDWKEFSLVRKLEDLYDPQLEDKKQKSAYTKAQSRGLSRELLSNIKKEKTLENFVFYATLRDLQIVTGLTELIKSEDIFAFDSSLEGDSVESVLKKAGVMFLALLRQSTEETDVSFDECFEFEYPDRLK